MAKNLQLFIRRKLTNCLGWQCLTSTEHFGIIFCSVIVFIVLSLAYMYYLGAARISNRDRMFVNRSGNRGTRSQNARSDEVGLAVSNSHPLSNYAPRIVYQPIVYNMGGFQVPSIQPLAAMPSHSQEFPGVAQQNTTPPQHHAYQQAVPPSASWPPNAQTPRAVPSMRLAGEIQNQESSWRQRLHRVLRIPVGRASTIASSSAPRTPRRRSSHSIQEDPGQTTSSQQDREGAPRRVAIRSAEPSSSRSALSREDAASNEAQSIQTDAATVHSDDFAIVNIPSSSLPHEAGALYRTTGNNSPQANNDLTAVRGRDNSSGTMSDMFSIPSVSSIQAGSVPNYVNDRLTRESH